MSWSGALLWFVLWVGSVWGCGVAVGGIGLWKVERQEEVGRENGMATDDVITSFGQSLSNPFLNILLARSLPSIIICTS